MIFVAAIVLGCAREWYLLLSKRKVSVLHESEYVALPDEAGV